MTFLPPMVTDPFDVVSLTKNLIRIPSYVHIKDKKGKPIPLQDRVDEIQISNYITSYLEKYTNLTIRKQLVAEGRYNIIASNSDKPKLVLLGHTDTVAPSQESIYDQFEAEIHDGKLYGLGAADMKSGLASILSAAALYKDVPDVMVLFYIDEEYDFAGMRALIKDLPKDARPELMLSGDGGNLEIGHGCRGLIEIHGMMKGKSAHASRPHLGINAINGVVDSMRSIQKNLDAFNHDSLGMSTVNLAVLEGGKAAKDNEGKVNIIEQVNAVPDIAKFKVDIRTASPDIQPKRIIEKLEQFSIENGLGLENIQLHHELGVWFTETNKLATLSQIAKKVTGNNNYFGNPSEGGYIDMQMLWDHWGRPPAAMFGAGPNEVMHQANEFVKVDDLLKSQAFFGEVLKTFQRN